LQLGAAHWHITLLSLSSSLNLQTTQQTAGTTRQLVMRLSLVAVNMQTTHHTAHSTQHHGVSMTLLLVLLM
jgi:hypothetical protein